MLDILYLYNPTFSFESEMKEIKLKMDSMADIYETLQEKMHDVDKTMWVNMLWILQIFFFDLEYNFNSLKYLFKIKKNFINSHKKVNNVIWKFKKFNNHVRGEVRWRRSVTIRLRFWVLVNIYVIRIRSFTAILDITFSRILTFPLLNLLVLWIVFILNIQNPKLKVHSSSYFVRNVSHLTTKVI